MLPGKRDFYRCCLARRSASHVNKEFRQQFQNYAPPSLRVIRTKIARTIIYIIYDSQLNRPESVSLASLARQLLLLEKWFPLWGERAHSLKLFCMYDKRFEISKTK